MTVGKSGQPLAELSKTDLQALERDWIEALTQVSGTNQQLDLSRGKPGAEQLNLSDALETMIAGNYISADLSLIHI